MADEPIEPNQPNEDEEVVEQPAPELEEAPEEQEQEEAPEAEPEAEQSEEEEPKPPSRREQLRVQQLLKKYGEPQQQPQNTPPAETPNYREMIDAPDEVYKQLEKTQQEFGQKQYQQGENAALQQMRTVEWRTTLHIDTPQVEQQYDMLDSKSENFHPALADTMNSLYLRTVGFDEKTGLVANPQIRYKDFVESYMELADELASSKVAKTTKNIARQTANTALRPDGSSAKRLNLNQPVENMSDAELKAYGKKMGLEPSR